MEHKWLNYDLHTHSYYSKESEASGMVKEMTAKEFVDTLISNGIDVFSITDHKVFSAEYYREILNYIKDKQIKVIPGCEFTVYLDKESNDFFHANIYFNPKGLDLGKLEKTITEIYSDGEKPLLGDIINKLNSSLFSYLIFPEANKSAGIDKVWDKINKLGEADRFLKNGIQRVFRAYDSSDSFNKTSADQWAFSYFKNSKEFSDIIMGKTDRDIEQLTDLISKCIKKRPDTKGFSKEVVKLTDIICEFGRYFSYFHFSDWHNAMPYKNLHKNLIYGTVDLFYETLELAVVDPVSRILILKSNENLNKPIHYIKKISFIMNDKTYEIDFEIGLNAVVGKRASGKSLLVAIILLLLNKNDDRFDSKYSKYYKIDKNSIVCETYDGSKISIGQLGSLEYIEQNTVNEIFNNPNLSPEFIRNKFPQIEEIDLSIYEELFSTLETTKLINANYKNLSPYFKMIIEVKKYMFNRISLLDITPLQTHFNNTIKSINNFLLYMKKLGFVGSEFSAVVKNIELSYAFIIKKISFYNNIISFINEKILKLIEKNTQTEERNRIEREDFNKSKKIILGNFDSLLNIQKIEWILSNFVIKSPQISCADYDNYLFVTSYSVDPNIKDNLINFLANNIKKIDNLSGLDLIKEYYLGHAILKSNKKKITDGLENKYIVNNIKLSHEIYEKCGAFDTSSIKTTKDVDKLIEDMLLESVSTSSLGKRSAVYLDLMLNADANILMFDQPEDNVDNDYISSYFVPLIKRKKNIKQLIFVTHNPSVAVYADAFNYIYAENIGGLKGISYYNYYLEKLDDKKRILNILDGGSASFGNRNLKYGNIIGEFK